MTILFIEIIYWNNDWMYVSSKVIRSIVSISRHFIKNLFP